MDQLTPQQQQLLLQQQLQQLQQLPQPQIQQPEQQQQNLDMLMMNVYYNHEASPTILSLQAPNFINASNPLANSAQATGLIGRYNILLNIIESLKKDVRPTYIGSKIPAERLKRNINMAKTELRNCLHELNKLNNAQQQTR